MIKKLDSKLFYKILNEELSGLISEEGEGLEFSQSGNNGINPSIKEQLVKYTEKLEPEAEAAADRQIQKCLRTGVPSIDYNFFDKNRISFYYITDYLAIAAKQEMATESGNLNARNALMTIFQPYSREQKIDSSKGGVNKMSAFYNKMGHFSSVQADRNKKNISIGSNSDDVDNFVTAFYKIFDKVINYFDPNKGKFNDVLSHFLSNRNKDAWRANQRVVKGERVKKHYSLDDKLSGDEDSDTIGSKIDSGVESDQFSTTRKIDQDYIKKLTNTILDIFDRVIKNKKRKEGEGSVDYQIFRMLVYDNMTTNEIAKKLNIQPGTIRTKISRLEDFLNNYIPEIEAAISSIMGRKFEFPNVGGKKILHIPSLRDEWEKKRENRRNSGEEGVDSEENPVTKWKKRAKGSNIGIADVMPEEVRIVAEMFINNNPEEYYEYKLKEAKEIKNKIESLNCLYEKFERAFSLLNEGSEVDTLDMFTHVKSFVEESIKVIHALYGEIHNIENVAYEISGEYKNIADDISQVVDPIIEQLELWPHKLQAMLGRIRMSYNPQRAHGL